jgi:hypothetical protein
VIGCGAAPAAVRSFTIHPPCAHEPNDHAAAMAEVRRRDRSGEAASRIFGPAFALEALRHDLGDLADRISTPAE